MFATLAVLLSALYVASSTSAPSPVPAAAQRALSDKCSFTLWHKQLYPFSKDAAQRKQNYIQINLLVDHANDDLAVDVRLARPAAAFNSYSRVAANRVFAVDGLLDGSNLTVRGDDGSDALRFQNDDLVWTADGPVEYADQAWCDSGSWDTSVADGNVKTRERRMDCAFPCERVEMDDEERMELR